MITAAKIKWAIGLIATLAIAIGGWHGMQLYQNRILVVMPDESPAQNPSAIFIPEGSGGGWNSPQPQDIFGNRSGIIYVPLNQTHHKAGWGQLQVSANKDGKEYFETLNTGTFDFPLTIKLHERPKSNQPSLLDQAKQLLDLGLQLKTEAKETTTPLPQSLAQDPSTTPIREREEAGSNVYSERYRIIADLDGDAANDLILSAAVETFGKMGGPWTVYLSREGKFNQIGTITAHPKAISLEPDFDRIRRDPGEVRYARIWVYLRSGGGRGGLGYYRVGEKTVEEVKGLEIYQGNGDPDLGRDIYAAVFKASPIKYTLERSQTNSKGEVTWAVDAQ
jgi:hypothetical protein